MHNRAFADVTPPSASTGIRTAVQTRSSSERPAGGPKPRFEGVSKTGPKTAKSAPSLAARSTLVNLVTGYADQEARRSDLADGRDREAV